MSELRKTETLIKIASKGEDENLSAAFSDMLAFFGYLDDEGSTNHRNIIMNLYANTNSTKRYTLVGIAHLMHVSEKTLKRYRERYTSCFQYYLNLNRNKKDN